MKEKSNKWHQVFLKANILLILIFGFVSCEEKGNMIEGIYASMDEGGILFTADELYFTNKSGQNLTEVDIVITLTGIKGDKAKVKRYWPTWSLGEKKEVSISSSDSVDKIQKFSIDGTCNEGYFDGYWIPSNREKE